MSPGATALLGLGYGSGDEDDSDADSGDSRRQGTATADAPVADAAVDGTVSAGTKSEAAAPVPPPAVAEPAFSRHQNVWLHRSEGKRVPARVLAFDPPSGLYTLLVEGRPERAAQQQLEALEPGGYSCGQS